MCFECQRHWKEQHKTAMEIANAHLDAQGVPEDSILRGLADTQLACNVNPILAIMMSRCWPSPTSIMQ